MIKEEFLSPPHPQEVTPSSSRKDGEAIFEVAEVWSVEMPLKM